MLALHRLACFDKALKLGGLALRAFVSTDDLLFLRLCNVLGRAVVHFLDSLRLKDGIGLDLDRIGHPIGQVANECVWAL